MTDENQATTDTGDAGDTGVDYQSMHWSQLKALLNAEGKEYTTKEEAIEFLTSLDKGDGETQDGATADADRKPPENTTPPPVPSAPKSKTPKFNKNEYYSEVHGIHEKGVRYYQNGHAFSAIGEYIKDA